MKVLLEYLNTFTSGSLFGDDIWIFDKLYRRKNGSYSHNKLYFTQCSVAYKDLIKKFALIRLLLNSKTSTVSSNLDGTNFFIKFLNNNYHQITLDKVNKQNINAYKNYLKRQAYLSIRTKETRWSGIAMFFHVMANYGYEYQSNIIGTTNPFSCTRSQKASLEIKYIPEDIAIQLDKVFLNDKLPLPHRAMYWICRLIPNRITEVASMEIDCIKPYINEKVLSIPMFKQNGGYIVPEIKNIAIEEIAVGKFLLDLVREQIELAKSLQEETRDEKKGFLFTYVPYYYHREDNSYTIFKNNKSNIRGVQLLNIDKFNNFLRNVCKRENIKDSNGEIYLLSSHKFRHNAISDRLYEGFRIIDITAMTHHKSSGMIIHNYTHINDSILQEKENEIIGEEKPTVLFKGHILNSTDDIVWQRIMRRPYAHKIGRLGICSDISNCESNMYECLNECDYFVPNADELEYFEEEAEQWKKKIDKFSNNQFIRENAQYNYALFQKVIDRIKKAIQ
jgi:hypothetical protein